MTIRRTIPFDYPAPGAAAALPGDGLPWLDALRAEGRRLSADGLPGTRMEAWKYTSLAPLAALDFPAPAGAHAVAEADPGPDAFAAADGPSLVFVNGRLSARHSRFDALPPGLRQLRRAQGQAADSAQVGARIGAAGPPHRA
ncbi:MAG: Fe-S cluster assembly protein SufD, partial [Rhodospirillales bacterium]|nr:Fe-S cluster assembly protein SufD [Rhodospirillales bacterium]